AQPSQCRARAREGLRVRRRVRERARERVRKTPLVLLFLLLFLLLVFLLLILLLLLLCLGLLHHAVTAVSTSFTLVVPSRNFAKPSSTRLGYFRSLRCPSSCVSSAPSAMRRDHSSSSGTISNRPSRPM